VYTLCRLIDDATDEAESLRAALGETAEMQSSGSLHASALLDFLFPSREPMSSNKETAVATFLEAALVASGAWTPKNPSPPVDSESSLVRARAFLFEARACARSLGLERAHFEELVAGQAMDEHFTQPADAAEFRLYCFRVAGVVGLLMARVFGARVAPATLEAAESLGLAMQITNILRDVREDFVTRGRIYLPADACARHGVHVPQSLADADAGGTSPGAAALVRHLGLQAVDAYRTALRGVSDIPSFRARLCVRLMAAVYGAILGVILLDPSLPFRRRVVVPQARRLFIAFKVLLGAHPLAAAGLARRRTP
jgi:phytoene synthase